jgi:hypothetical protein
MGKMRNTTMLLFIMVGLLKLYKIAPFGVVNTCTIAPAKR